VTLPRDVPLPDRRRFLMLMGLACASTAIQPSRAAIAQTGGGAPIPPPTQAGTPTEKKAASPEALALTEVVKLRYGDHLTAEQLGAIALDLDARLEGGRELRKLSLANGDEPDTIFHA
jgi:hypothetical protein